MIASLKILIRYLPELITIIRGITRIIAEAEEKAVQKKAIDDISKAFKDKDVTRLNGAFNKLLK